MIKPAIAILSLGVSILLISACSENTDSSALSKVLLAPATAITLDTRRQDIYTINCAVCHGMAGTGAPHSGKLTDWQQRSSKGMATMLNHAMDGYQSMPAMGGCFDCNEEDFRLLITYMSGGLLG